MNRKELLAFGELYHVYNRGVDRRTIFESVDDVNRFMESLVLMNQESTIGSIRNYHDHTQAPDLSDPLVEILAYCLLDNHYHFIIRPLSNDGLSRFMHKINGGYTSYFNRNHKRSGSLFQGKFKTKHIDTDAYLEHVVAYVHANHILHDHKGWKFSGPQTPISSLTEYTGSNPFVLCNRTLYNPTGSDDSTYAQWCIDHVKEIKRDRAEYPWMYE